jgi:hypothetical protein
MRMKSAKKIAAGSWVRVKKASEYVPVGVWQVTGADDAKSLLVRAPCLCCNVEESYAVERRDCVPTSKPRKPVAKGFFVGSRSDYYAFFIERRGNGVTLNAGCRSFSLRRAKKHWVSTRGGTPLGDESLALVAKAENLAVRLGWRKS